MTCLPESGGCERPFTEAFVEYLNQREGTRYAHRSCLDVMERRLAQPEALYVDENRGLELVIERKSISWPTDYPYRHSNDHFVFEVFSQALKDFRFDDLYEIRFPMLIRGKREDLCPFVLAAADKVRANWSKIQSGAALKERVTADWWWGFRRVPDEEREEGSSAKGLLATWVGRSMLLNDYLDPLRPPDGLSLALRKIYVSCAAKFTSYPHARRVLVLDPLGDLRHEPKDWWHSLWSTLSPATEIGEIWSGIYDFVDDESQEWRFECLYQHPPSEREL